jgi:hypothetical protein
MDENKKFQLLRRKGYSFTMNKEGNVYSVSCKSPVGDEYIYSITASSGRGMTFHTLIKRLFSTMPTEIFTEDV